MNGADHRVRKSASPSQMYNFNIGSGVRCLQTGNRIAATALPQTLRPRVGVAITETKIIAGAFAQHFKIAIVILMLNTLAYSFNT